ncbi:Vitamin K-dependent gamma-carboxylase [Stieleria maiorica]|uniref:Vitamin K-dependent gamma-carboxylase n=1 Tax=Stieleria maiorica TaxID=2795974 RepID=A0A5B9MDN0_9BACT|nr:HTTM domain-containing protein [Stieleria maiorica]QEF99188.1 Vitamin K-dependent gamma-carboxylase [Stieleria maiorica]
MSSDSHRRFDWMRPVDASPLAVLRFILGVTFWFWASDYLAEDRWHILFVSPTVLFKYAWFEWVTLWPGDGIWWHFQAARISALAFAVGFLTRVNAAILAATMAYVLLVERQIYNNHDYLLACTAMLCCFLPCGRTLSLDQLLFRGSRGDSNMRLWQWWLVRFQLGLPYVFGGIAKLDSDWIAGQPAGLFVTSRVDTAWIGPLFTLPGAPFVMAWGGLLFDVLIVPALMWKRTRVIAIAAALVFHLTNATIFQIGVFPWFMLATLFVFFPVSFVPNVLRRIGAVSGMTPDSGAAIESTWCPPASRLHRLAIALSVAYVTVQLLLPVRPWVLPGNPSWNERGQRFAWRMMLRHKDCLLWYRIQTQDDYLIVPAKIVMTPNQLMRAPRDPELVRQAAVKLQELVASMGQPGCKVFALHLVSLNGRPATPLVDPSVDLTQAARGWFDDDWVIQDPGPLPPTPWRVPLDQWWQHIEMPATFHEIRSMRPSEAEAEYDRLAEQQRAMQSS